MTLSSDTWKRMVERPGPVANHKETGYKQIVKIKQGIHPAESKCGKSVLQGFEGVYATSVKTARKTKCVHKSISNVNGTDLAMNALHPVLAAVQSRVQLRLLAKQPENVQ